MLSGEKAPTIILCLIIGTHVQAKWNILFQAPSKDELAADAMLL